MEETMQTPIKNIQRFEQISPNTPRTYKTPLKQYTAEKIKSKHRDSMGTLAVLSNHFTPPSRITKFIAQNPFDVELTSRLHLSVISPTMFKKVSPKTQDSPFSWTIEELSLMKPAKIDEFPVQQAHCTDPEVEFKAQEAINKFFHENQIHPSPWNDRKEPMRPLVMMTPSRNYSVIHESREVEKSTRDCWTQTTLSLPVNLPEHLEEALKPYYTFSQEQQTDDSNDSNASNSSLRRKLFFNNDESTDDENDCSVILSPIKSSFSPLQSGMLVHGTPIRRFSLDMFRSRDSSFKQSDKLLSPPDISPIRNSTDMSCQSIRSRGRLAARLDFNGHMSVDISLSEENECDFKTLDKCPETPPNNDKSSNQLQNEEECDKNETVEMISFTEAATPLKACTDKNDMLDKLEDAADWYKNGSDKSFKLRRNITSVGNFEQSSAFISSATHDTGYQTYSINNTTNNINNDSTTPLKKGLHWDEQINGMSPIDKIRLSDWQDNIQSMFSSTPSKYVQRNF